jgi:alpha-1,2-mannosyltransferase
MNEQPPSALRICGDTLRSGVWLTVERVKLFSILISVVGMAGLMFIWLTGSGLTDRFGRPIATDFSGMWHAGKMVLAGNASGAFDPQTHFAFQRNSFGNPDIDVFGWHYPPFFLGIAAVLALMPYLVALAAWQLSTFALFYGALRQIVGSHPLLPYVVIGFPAVFVTLGHGHNAFLTAGLLALGLHFRHTRPWLAGLCIGLLAYKPQFGVVLPLVLLMSGNFRAFLAAGLTVLVMTLAVTGVWGFEIWQAFFKGAEFTRMVVLEQGNTGWEKIQSIFSATRLWGGTISQAYLAQLLLSCAVVVSLAWACWRKIAADHINVMVAVGALLATPYSLDYDMTLLGVCIAFAVKRGLQHGFAPFEKTLLALAWCAPLFARGAMAATGVPIGLIVMLALWGFYVHRTSLSGRIL